MSLKILGGVAKGHSLLVPKGDLIRPTSVRLRRRLFDSHQNWEGRVFVDLCGGSGAMGLEAWSRGADEVFLIESQRKVFELMSKNAKGFIQKFNDRGSINSSNRACQKWLQDFSLQYGNWAQEKKRETVIFFDPPYRDKELYDKIACKQLLENNWFEGELWIESDRQKGLAIDYWSEKGFYPRKSFTQGTSYIAIFTFEAGTKLDS